MEVASSAVSRFQSAGDGLGLTEGGMRASMVSYSTLPFMMMGKKCGCPDACVWFSL